MQIDKVYQSPEILQFLNSYANNPQGFAVFAGKNGTGKTFAAEQVYKYFRVEDSDDKIFTTQTMLNLNWQKHFTEYGETLYILKQLTTTKLLIIDDLGTRTPSEAFMDFLYAIVESRYRGRFSQGTIITTNLNAKDMREKFGDAFVSRVASGKCFRFEGDDRRFNEF